MGGLVVDRLGQRVGVASRARLQKVVPWVVAGVGALDPPRIGPGRLLPESLIRRSLSPVPMLISRWAGIGGVEVLLRSL